MKKISIIGLGYVGLPLAVELGKQYTTVGFDINNERVEELITGFDRTKEVDALELKKAKSLSFTNSTKDISDSQIYIVTVPTPIDDKNKPDLNPIIKSTEMISKILNVGDIVIYESTVYPGVTEEVCVPILEKSNLKFNKDFFCGYSPERINPGDKERPLRKIKKVTSGSNPKIAKEVDDLYKSIIDAGTHLAPSIKVAEAAKVIENTQRDVNIALINELALIFDSLNIDTNAVLEAASSKWNFINLKPGLVGGHCIGVDPYYLTYKAKSVGYRPNLILQSRHINNGMSKYIVEKLIKLLIDREQRIKNANVLVLGVTFKENCPDMRNSKVVDIIEELKDYGSVVDVYDPWVDPEENKKSYTHGIIDNPFLASKKYEAIIAAVAHDEFKSLSEKNLDNILVENGVIIDIKGSLVKSTWKL